MCSCEKAASCSCEKPTSCSCEDSMGCSCCDDTEKIINPKTVIPISSSEAASNKYSIETEIKARNGSGKQNNTRAGVATGDTTADIVANIHVSLVDVTVDIIRSVIGETFISTNNTSITNTTIVPATDLLTLTAFQAYFSTGAQIGTPLTALTTSQTNHLNYITQTMYPIFLSIQKHIETSEESVEVCPPGSSRLFQVSVKNCLFCLKLIFN